MINKRILVAALIFFSAHIILSEIMSAVGIEPWTIYGFDVPIVWFVSALLAAWYAGSRFIVPAVAVWGALWTLIVLLLYQVAAPTGQASVLGILQFNALGLVTSLVAVALGVYLGQVISRRRLHDERTAA